MSVGAGLVAWSTHLHCFRADCAGIIGGLTPFAVSGVIGDLGADMKAFAPAFWLLALGGASLVGCVLMRMYAPRINKPFIGRVE